MPALLDRSGRGIRGAASDGRIAGQADVDFAELGARVDRLARGLRGLGVRAGDAVALLMPNSPAHPVAFFAVLRLGARVVHLTPLDPARAVMRKIEDSEAGTLITTNLASVLPQAAGGAGRGGTVDRGRRRGMGAGRGGDAELPDGGDRDVGALDGAEGGIGRTLAPRGCGVAAVYRGDDRGNLGRRMLTHANLTSTVSIYDVWNSGAGAGVPGQGDRMLCVLPLFHIYALTAVMLRAIS